MPEPMRECIRPELPSPLRLARPKEHPEGRMRVRSAPKQHVPMTTKDKEQKMSHTISRFIHAAECSTAEPSARRQ